MRVLLINPPRENEIIGNNPEIIESERGYNPPLGLLYLASYLEQHTDHQVWVIDAQVQQLSHVRLQAEIARVRPDAVGITVMTLTLLDVMLTVESVKSVNRDITVILGGPHVHLFPDESIQLPDVDYLVLGEGEEAFADLLDHLGDREALACTQGIVFRDGDGIINTGVRPFIDDLDRLPFPARHLVPYEKYTSLLSKGGVVTTTFTSRGCPFQCSFCDRPQLGKRFRARSAGNVVDEMETCVEMGIHEFLIYDDTFTVKKDRAVEVCNEIVKRGLDVSFDIRSRVDTIDETVIKALKAAGCAGIHYGVEAGTNRVLKILNKGISLEQVRVAFDLTRQYDIPILAYWMIGNPHETLADIHETFRLQRQLKPDFVHMTVLTPFPGTEVYREAMETGIIEGDVWRAFAANPTPGFEPPHWGENFTREELNELLVYGYKQFYMRPGYILQRIAKLRSWSEFRKKARAGLRVLTMGRG